MGGIEFMPGEVPPFLGEMIVDLSAPLGRDMGVLATED